MKPADRTILAVALALSIASLVVSLRRPTARGGGTAEEASDGQERAKERGSGRRVVDESELRLLEERLSRLEKRDSEPAARPPVEGSVEPAVAKPDEADAEVRSLVAIATDATAHPATRLGALKQLRRKAPAARSGAVAASMMELLRTETDESRRADIIRQLHGVKDDVAKREFLERLKLDESESVRNEAAESLDQMLDDPAVVAALEWARDHDVSERVRNQAGESLASRK